MNPVTEHFSPERRAGVLIETLPYIQRFKGSVIVVKFGGNAMVDRQLAAQFAEDIVLMHSVGIRPVVVHGGGPQIGELMDRLGLKSEFRDGLRVTDAATLDVARMVLVGKVGRDIVSGINVHGPLAVGLSGEDGGLIRATARDPELGFVGDVESVNPAIVERLLAEELIPVISTIGADVTVGHGAKFECCTIGDRTVVGMNAVILQGATIGSECVLAANTVVLEGAEIPDRCVVAGVPGVIKKRLDGSSAAWISGGGSHYVELSRRYGAEGIGLPDE